MSAETATALLSMILDQIGKAPLYILFADVKKAYDKLWREALWAKLLAAHPSLIDVKRIKALYKHFVAKIAEPSFVSEVIHFFLGVPQGGPRSGDLFCFFTSDLVSDLKSAGLGAEVFETFLVCLVYMDDWMLPLCSPSGVVTALACLHRYAVKWSLTWALDKVKVLPVNVKNPRLLWPFGNVTIHSVTQETWLSVIYITKIKWAPHHTNRIYIAKFAASKLRAAGLLGGSNAPALSIQVMRAVVWATLDYGRAAAPPQTKATATSLSRFQLNLLRETLNLSKSAPIDGVLGESGDLGDKWRDARKPCLVAHSLLSSPVGSLPNSMAWTAFRSGDGTNLIARAMRLMTSVDSSPSILGQANAKPTIKK